MKIVCIKMRYSIERRDRVYVKGYGFLSFAKNMGKSSSNKYSQNFLIVLKNLQQRNKNCIKKRNSKNSRSNWWFDC